MIYTFRILSSEVEDFFCDIAIRSDQTFYELHSCIQDTAGYDSSQLASFFLTTGNWEKKMQITLLDMKDFETETLVMDKTVIGDLLKKVKDKLLYVFDFFSERSFFIELTDIQDDTDGHFPACIASHGEPPIQILMGNSGISGIFEEEFAADDDMDDDNDFFEGDMGDNYKSFEEFDEIR